MLRGAQLNSTRTSAITAGKDHRTYDLAKAILQKEIQHEYWFSEYLEEGPSGHFKRGESKSPYVSKFLE